MDLLDQVPGIKEHMESLEVQFGNKILKRRIDLGLTQERLVELIKQRGDLITQATVSKVECGEGNFGSDTYNKILSALGGITDFDIVFGSVQESSSNAR